MEEIDDVVRSLALCPHSRATIAQRPMNWLAAVIIYYLPNYGLPRAHVIRYLPHSVQRDIALCHAYIYDQDNTPRPKRHFDELTICCFSFRANASAHARSTWKAIAAIKSDANYWINYQIVIEDGCMRVSISIASFAAHHIRIQFSTWI